MERTRQDRARRAALAWCAAALLCAAVFFLRPPCLIRQTFGVLCPACGTTRMISRLLRLDLAGALRENGLMLFLLPVFLLYAVLETVRYLRGKRLLSSRPAAWAALAAVTLLAVAFAVWRNLL